MFRRNHAFPQPATLHQKSNVTYSSWNMKHYERKKLYFHYKIGGWPTIKAVPAQCSGKNNDRETQSEQVKATKERYRAMMMESILPELVQLILYRQKIFYLKRTTRHLMEQNQTHT